MNHATDKYQQWRLAEAVSEAAVHRNVAKVLRAASGGPTVTADELQEALDLRKLASERLADYIYQTKVDAQALSWSRRSNPAHDHLR